MVQRGGCNREIELADDLTPIEQPSILLAESSRDLLRKREHNNPGEKSSETFCGLLRIPGAVDACNKFGKRHRANTKSLTPDRLDSCSDLVLAPQKPDGPVGVQKERHLELDRRATPTSSSLVHFLDELFRNEILPRSKRRQKGCAIVNFLPRNEDLHDLILGEFDRFEGFEYAVPVSSFDDFAQRGTSFSTLTSIHEIDHEARARETQPTERIGTCKGSPSARSISSLNAPGPKR